MKTVLDIIVHELTGIPYHVGHERMLTEAKRIFVADTPRTEFLNAMRFIGILLMDHSAIVNLTDVERYKLLISVTAFYIIAQRGPKINICEEETTSPPHYILTALMLKAGGFDILNVIGSEGEQSDADIIKTITPYVNVDLETCDALVTKHLTDQGFDFS